MSTVNVKGENQVVAGTHHFKCWIATQIKTAGWNSYGLCTTIEDNLD